MRKKKEIIPIAPLSVGEVCLLSRLASGLGYKIKNGVPNLKGAYSHYQIKDLKKFDKKNIDLMRKWFRADKNAELLYEEKRNGEFFVLEFAKLAKYV